MMIRYKRIENVLNSLKNSSDLQVKMINEGIRADGLNSPYTSHQSIQLIGGHNVAHCATLSNSKVDMAIFCGCHEPQNIIAKGCNFHCVPVPAYHFRNDRFFQFPLSIPIWIEKSIGNVFVIIPDLFTGYNDDGDPIWSYDTYQIYAGNRLIISSD